MTKRILGAFSYLPDNFREIGPAAFDLGFDVPALGGIAKSVEYFR
jgi:hypothetical protein